MRWRGVSVDTLFEHIDIDPAAAFVIAWSDGGYTTNRRHHHRQALVTGQELLLARGDRFAYAGHRKHLDPDLALRFHPTML
jgi:hypothetical protein